MTLVRQRAFRFKLVYAMGTDLKRYLQSPILLALIRRVASTTLNTQLLHINLSLTVLLKYISKSEISQRLDELSRIFQILNVNYTDPTNLTNRIPFESKLTTI